jgi:predicted nucleic acid-binding protein
MTRVFIDASVFFAACYSKTGSSRELFHRATREEITIVVSSHVLMEVERNLHLKAPAAIPAFQELVDLLPTEVVGRPSLEEVQRAAVYTELKDAPIVAAAIKSGVCYLATWDRKHLVDDPAVASGSGLRIITPDELLGLLGRDEREQTT